MDRGPETFVGKAFGGFGDFIYNYLILCLIILSIYLFFKILKGLLIYLDKKTDEIYRKTKSLPTIEEERKETERIWKIEANRYHKQRLLDDFIQEYQDLDAAGSYTLRDHWFNSYQISTDVGIFDILNRVESGQIKFQELMSTSPLRLQDIEKIYFKKDHVM
jgi:hypothetical protein